MMAIKNLRQIVERCHQGQPLDEELSEWLVSSISLFLNHTCKTVDEALGLKSPQGGVPWWREEAIRRRDDSLRKLAHRFYEGFAPSGRAKEIRTLADRYAATSWRFDRERSDMPANYLDTPKELLWQAFKSGATMPIGERQLRNILGP